MSELTELEQLTAIIAEDWRDLAWEGDACDGFKTVAEEAGEDRRWSRTITAIVEAPSGQLFGFDWEHGLTEYQENDCYSPRVRPVKMVERSVIIREYVEDTK